MGTYDECSERNDSVTSNECGIFCVCTYLCLSAGVRVFVIIDFVFER